MHLILRPFKDTRTSAHFVQTMNNIVEHDSFEAILMLKQLACNASSKADSMASSLHNCGVLVHLVENLSRISSTSAPSWNLNMQLVSYLESSKDGDLKKDLDRSYGLCLIA